MATDTTTNSSKTLVIVIVVIAILVGGYYFFYGKDHRSGGERLGDAVDTFSETHSLGGAADQLGDRTPAQKVGDAIEEKTQ